MENSTRRQGVCFKLGDTLITWSVVSEPIDDLAIGKPVVCTVVRRVFVKGHVLISEDVLHLHGDEAQLILNQDTLKDNPGYWKVHYHLDEYTDKATD